MDTSLPVLIESCMIAKGFMGFMDFRSWWRGELGHKRYEIVIAISFS